MPNQSSASATLGSMASVLRSLKTAKVETIASAATKCCTLKSVCRATAVLRSRSQRLQMPCDEGISKLLSPRPARAAAMARWAHARATSEKWTNPPVYVGRCIRAAEKK